MYLRMSVTFFLTSDFLHLESNIYVGLLAYIRMHARQRLKLEVRHKNSHGRIHTHTHTKRTDTRTQARTYMYARMYLHADTHLYPYTHVRMYVCALYTYSADPDQTQYIVASDQGLYCWLLQ